MEPATTATTRVTYQMDDAPSISADLLDSAVELVRQAGAITLRYFRSGVVSAERKADGTPVTQADRETELFLRKELATLHPDDAVTGEELGTTDGESQRRWHVDPIDGTKAFIQGVPLYATLLALEDEHGPALGIVHMPALQETVYAGRGLGCWCNAVPAKVSGRTEREGAYLTTSGFDYWPWAALEAARRSSMQMRTWGDGYGYALVATGRAEAMVDPLAATWDLAPMQVLLREAGGRFSDLSGQDRIDGGSGIATNGICHDAVLAFFGEVRA